MRGNDHWQYQGRQYHGWFRHGTGPGGRGEDAMTAALDGAIGAMPAAERRRYEAALADGAREDLAVAMRASVGPHGTMARDGQGSAGGGTVSSGIGAELRAAALNAVGTPAQRVAASSGIADMARKLGTGNLRRVAAQLARDAVTERERNIKDLTRIIYHEAGGESGLAQVAVGWVVVNRTRRNRTAAVEDVAAGFARSRIEPDLSKKENDVVRTIATAILDGLVPDPTNGATQFYTPRRMPKEGQPVGKSDVRGGLESVSGVLGAQDRPVRNYRPGWPDSRLPSGKPAFTEVAVPGVPVASFRFFRAAGDGHVR
ncbi:MAG: cell wall hydrolase [Alphaproteobacteria bacterium]|nr:cell wall hydrolase [Alphaproteobacteria bacterium]